MAAYLWLLYFLFPSARSSGLNSVSVHCRLCACKSAVFVGSQYSLHNSCMAYLPSRRSCLCLFNGVNTKKEHREHADKMQGYSIPLSNVEITVDCCSRIAVVHTFHERWDPCACTAVFCVAHQRLRTRWKLIICVEHAQCDNLSLLESREPHFEGVTSLSNCRNLSTLCRVGFHATLTFTRNLEADRGCRCTSRVSGICRW